MSDFRVRAARVEDFDRWAPLWRGYLEFYKAEVADDITRLTWKRFFDPVEPMHALVAEKEGELIGICHYLFHRNTWMVAPVCYLQDLFTHAEARGLGVGRALIEAVYSAAREHGSPRVYWTTQENNSSARILYDKVAAFSGFIQYRKALNP